MSSTYYLRDFKFNSTEEEFSSILLENAEDHSLQEWRLSEELMGFSLKNEICIQKDPLAQVLIYTAKKKDSGIKYTIKVFYKGNQENLLDREEYKKQLL